jgi:hypothetical protein
MISKRVGLAACCGLGQSALRAGGKDPANGGLGWTNGGKLKDPNTKDEPFEDVVKSAQAAAVLVLVY